MMTITNNGMADITNYIKRDVVYAEYKSGSTWHRIALHDIRVISATKIAIYIMFGVDVPNVISGIRLCSAAGQIWAQDTQVVINKTSYPEGILYRFTITLVQESET
jgi:hypothetical protein